MNADERIEAASSFLLQSPPGEINDVLNDIRTIISDDDSLQTGILPALHKYNVAQFITVDVPGQAHQVIISEAGRDKDDSNRFIDPRSKQSFAFDHLRLEASDTQAIEPDSSSEPFREALERATLAYVEDHFHDGVASVFADLDAPKTFTVQIVANKYNPPNFWAGRWRSEYIVDLDKGEARGTVLVNVHYYEQGNVQLATTHKPTLDLPSSLHTPEPANASKILALIEREESAHESALSAAFQDMADKSFKSLRRALPLTKQKLDWDKVSGYKLGAELTASRGIFGTSTEDVS
ncbi:F-actin capping protein, alpha subunit [Auricularia subglabra TFB-10046 SS5]|nr:F-actin capping protein, alpha subunit [Auricularia subglabra TFB-10046 SS5]